MSLTRIEQHRSFEGEQRKYSHCSEVLQCDMKFSIYLPSNKEKKNPAYMVVIWFNLYR